MLWLHKAVRRIKDQEPRQNNFTSLNKSSFSKALFAENKLLDQSVSSPLCSCLQQDVPCHTLALPCQQDFKGGSQPRGLDVHVDGETHFYRNWRNLGSTTTTSAFNARGASQTFPAEKVLSRGQPASTGKWPQHCGSPGMAPWDQQTLLDRAGLPHSTPFLLTAGVRACYGKTLQENTWTAALLCNAAVFQQDILVFQNLSPWSAGEEVQVLLFEEKGMESAEPQDPLTPAHSGHCFPFYIRTIKWKERCSTGMRQKGSTHFCPTATLLQISQQQRTRLGWRALQIHLV